MQLSFNANSIEYDVFFSTTFENWNVQNSCTYIICVLNETFLDIHYHIIMIKQYLRSCCCWPRGFTMWASVAPVSWTEMKRRRRRRRDQTIGAKNRPMRKRPVGPTASRRARAHWALRQQWGTNMAVSIARLPAVNLQTLALTFLTAVILHRSVADLSVGTPPASEEPPHRRFEYKYSFKGPHLSQSDGSIPFWIHTGSKFGSSCVFSWTPEETAQVLAALASQSPLLLLKQGPIPYLKVKSLLPY